MTTKTIGTGGDYSTIASWFAACPANLVSSTQAWIGALKNETFTLTANVSLAGITTNSTYYLELTTDTGASFADHADIQTNALRYNTSNGAAITCSTPWVVMFGDPGATHVKLTKLQIRGAHNNCTTVDQTSTSGNLTIDRCIIETQHSTNGAAMLYGSGSTVRNSLLINRRSSSVGPALGIGNGAAAYNCTLACTAAAGAVALTGNYGTPTVKNCAVFGFTAIKSGGNTPTYTSCATDIASPPSGFTGSLTGSSQFESLTDGSHDFRVKSGASLIDAGTTESTYAATDIAGTSRPSGSAYDVGAWEYVSGGGSSATATAAAGTSTVSASGSSTAATTATVAAGVATVSGVGGTLVVLVSSAFKNNTGTALASLTDVTAWVNAVESGALVVKLTGQATNGSGVCTLQDAAIVTGTQYRVTYRNEATGDWGSELVTAT